MQGLDVSKHGERAYSVSEAAVIINGAGSLSRAASGTQIGMKSTV